MTIYSHSRLSTYENCPLQYKFSYIDKIKVPDGEESIEAFLGSRFHEVMEKLYGDLKIKTLLLDELLTHYDQIWTKNYTESVSIVKKDRTAKDYKDMGVNFIKSYYQQYYPFNKAKTLGIEKEIRIDLNNDGKYMLRGYIDRIDDLGKGVYEIHDYKTSATLPEQRYLDNDRQLALYHIGLQNMWPEVKDVNLVWHYVAFDKEMTSKRTKSQLNDLKKEVIALIDEIEAAETYKPNESNLCDWCDFQEHCPKKKHLFKTASLPENEYLKEDGVKLVKAYEKLKEQKREYEAKAAEIDEELEKVEEAVIKYAEKQKIDTLYGDTHKLSVKTKDKVSFPPKNTEEREELNQAIHSLGKWNEVSTLDTSQLSKIVLENQWPSTTLAKINKFIEKSVTQTVSYSKSKEEKEI